MVPLFFLNCLQLSTQSRKLQEAYPGSGGTDSGIWYAGLMFSDLLLDVEYLIVNLKWNPKMYNRLKLSAFVEGGEVCKTPATQSHSQEDPYESMWITYESMMQT